MRSWFFWMCGVGLLWASSSAKDDTKPEIDVPTQGKSYFFWDGNLSLFYSFDGADLAGTGYSHWLPSDGAPSNAFGFEFMHYFASQESFGVFAPNFFVVNPHIELDVHPRGMIPQTFYPIWFEPRDSPTGRSFIEFGGKTLDFNHGQNRTSLKLVFYDFWLRFKHRDNERLSFRLGHFDIPYGSNPIYSARHGTFITPSEVQDIGFKKDWGAEVRGPIRDYDYHVAFTTGQGLGFGNPHWLDGKKKGEHLAGIYDVAPSYVLSARVGSPNYWKTNFGLSALLGRVPLLMGYRRLEDYAKWRWRVGADMFHRSANQRFVMLAQLGMGQNEDRFGDDDASPDETLAGHILFEYIPTGILGTQKLMFTYQYKAILYDLWDSNKKSLISTFEINYSLSDAITLRLNWVYDFEMPTYTYAMAARKTLKDTWEPLGRPDNRIYLSISYYK